MNSTSGNIRIFKTTTEQMFSWARDGIFVGWAEGREWRLDVLVLTVGSFADVSKLRRKKVFVLPKVLFQSPCRVLGEECCDMI